MARVSKRLHFSVTVCILALALTTVTTTANTVTADWPAVIKQAARSFARMEIQVGDKTAACSGAVINADSGHLLTNAHCVGPMGTKDLSITVNERHAEVVRSNTLIDLAAVRFQVKGEVSIPLADKAPEQGAEAAILGYPFGSEQMAPTFGRVSVPFHEKSKSLWLNVMGIPGISGGGVIDAQGRLIGMPNAIYYAGPASMAVAIPLEAIRDFAEPYLPVKK